MTANGDATSGKAKSHTRTIRTHRARETFLQVFRERANVSEAARIAGVGRRTVYDWYARDDEFARQWDDAKEDAADALEREAWRRAVEGIEKPISYQGRVTDTYREYSDRMLEMLLRAHRPEKYSEKHQVAHMGGMTVSIYMDTKPLDED